MVVFVFSVSDHSIHIMVTAIEKHHLSPAYQMVQDVFLGEGDTENVAMMTISNYGF